MDGVVDGKGGCVVVLPVRGAAALDLAVGPDQEQVADGHVAEVDAEAGVCKVWE